ncbi:hypothetical protein AB0G04_10335 [Actinoplanes sp. NPDC023801]|uniref:hypothetical protein n=1 Tax=Actinoplanes sp. NPDC023801 TaxID=3154595 RepID=UPI0033D7ADB3
MTTATAGRTAPVLVMLAAIGFIATVVVLIARTPLPGEATAAGLAAAYQQALADQDTDAINRLTHGLPDDAAAIAVLLSPTPCGGQVGQVRAVNATVDTATLLLYDRSGRSCAQMAIAAHDGRWFIDPWAAPFREPQ